MAEEKAKELISGSLAIAVVKKNIFDIILHTLKKEGIKANRQLIIRLINEVPTNEFTELEKKSEDRRSYSKQVEEIVKVVLKKYIFTQRMEVR